MGIKVKGEGVLDRALSIILAVALLGALVALVYTLANPKVDPFTEFYILGLDGKATDYPQELSVGETGKVLMGIINREQETATYWVEITINGVKNKKLGMVTLEDDEEWKQIVGFIPDKAGDNQKVEFLLYRQGYDGVYRSLHLWVNVR